MSTFDNIVDAMVGAKEQIERLQLRLEDEIRDRAEAEAVVLAQEGAIGRLTAENGSLRETLAAERAETVERIKHVAEIAARLGARLI